MAEKRSRHNPPHVPTDANRQAVQLHAMVGTTQENIAGLLGISVDTLAKYYRKELDTSLDMANAAVGGALYRKAINGDTTAMIFWMKTRARWRETSDLKIEQEVTYVLRAPDEAKDVSEWLRDYGPRVIEADAQKPSGSPSPDRKRLS